MNTWSVAQMILDISFAVTFVALIVGFLYYRERRISLELVNSLSNFDASVSGIERNETAVVQENDTTAPDRAGRVEKYLEAVRLHRQGRDPREIEHRLGVSMVELELLGRVKQ